MLRWLLIGLLASCASSPSQKIIRELSSSKQFDKALLALEESDLQKKQRNRFLYLLEKGQIHFLANENRQALNAWEPAREILKTYYRTKTVDKISSSIANNNYSDFQGDYFEQHAFFLQLSLAYLRLAQSPEINSRQRVQYLASARAAVVDWDSFIKGLQRNNVQKLNQESFLARFYGSLVHEMIGSREDLQIAFELMKDARDLMGLYPKFQVIPPSIKKHIGRALIRQSLKLGRRRQALNFGKLYQLKIDQVDKYPALALISNGRIAEKTVATVPFSLEFAMRNPSMGVRADLLSLGMASINAFSYNILKLGFHGYHYHYPSYIGYRYSLGQIMLGFEVPVRAEATQQKKQAQEGAFFATVLATSHESLEQEKFKARNVAEGAGKSIEFLPVFSLSEQSRAMVDENFESLYMAAGMRVSMKYIAAIISAYKLYQSLEHSQQNTGRGDRRPGLGAGWGSGLSHLAVSSSFALAVAAIRASERADTRYWSTLPGQLLLAELSLPPGEYRLINSGEKTPVFLRQSQAFEIFSFSFR